MIQATNFIELNRNCSAAINDLNATLTNFSSTFRNLPISEALKNKRISLSIKEKAAWYACMVNPNIDVLLLTDYFETRQSRNILLKKETEQYISASGKFAELRSIVSNASLYENVFAEKDERLSEFDLFSKQVSKREICPETLTKLFDQWLLNPVGESDFEKIIYQFCEWHSHNNFSFTGQRHFLLWFNFQLHKLFGDASLLLNVEHYFFHHWNKESRSAEKSIRQLIFFLQEACSGLQSELKKLYREEISYDSFDSLQRIANNYLYHTGFNFPLNQLTHADDYSVQFSKIMVRKGFVSSTDINFKVQLDKVKLTLQNWHKTGLINVVFNGNVWLAYMLPIEQKTRRLQVFCNIEHSFNEPEWNLVFAKPIIQIQPTEKPISESPRKVARQKVFFG